MYVPWQWIREKTGWADNYSANEFVKQLNYYGLECEENLTEGILFINFLIAHNRRDLRSWWGLAREISILLGSGKTGSFSNQSEVAYDQLGNQISGLQLIIKSEKVIEYNLLSLHNLRATKSLPIWMLRTLTKNGIKNTNPLVDIANFVTLETGQPFHLFDLDKLQHLSANREIIIREAGGSEFFTDLHKQTRKLSPGSLLMESNGEVIELVGIIGGKRTAIEHSTRTILIESGSFSAGTIELTSNELAVRSRASEIFTNFHNQENPGSAIRRLEEIIGEFYSYQRDKTGSFSHPRKQRTAAGRELIISRDFIERKLGFPLSEEKIRTTLERLNFSFEKRGNFYIVEIPSFRSDIKLREDLLEEIGKLLDYNLLRGKPLVSHNEFIDLQFNSIYNLRKKVALYLISNGYQEVLSYSLIRDSHRAEGGILLTNPESSAHALYRNSFISSHLQIIKHNRGQGRENLFFFEIGNVYNRKCRSELPTSEEILSIIATGKLVKVRVHHLEQQVDPYWMKGLLENLLMIMNIDKFTMETVEFTSSADPNYPILVEGIRIGFIRQLSSVTLAENGLQKTPSLVLQLSLSKLLAILAKQGGGKYSPVSYLPIIRRNISFLVEKHTPLGKISEEIKREGGEFLLEASLVDLYQKEEGSSLQSLNFQLLFQGKNTNLQNAEIELKIKKIWEVLTRKFSVLER